MIRTLPFVLVETEFALKGGTAINLFVRDLPRLSVLNDGSTRVFGRHNGA